MMDLAQKQCNGLCMGTEKNLLDGLKRKNFGVSEGFVIEIDKGVVRWTFLSEV